MESAIIKSEHFSLERSVIGVSVPIVSAVRNSCNGKAENELLVQPSMFSLEIM